MIYDVRLTLTASNDIKEIYEYIAFELQAVKSAGDLIERFEKGIKSLNQMPNRYRIYDSEPWKSRNLRIMPIDNYLIFYIPDNAEKVVTIIRVMYGGRNISADLI